jgi:hypothetical protein
MLRYPCVVRSGERTFAHIVFATATAARDAVATGTVTIAGGAVTVEASRPRFRRSRE